MDEFTGERVVPGQVEIDLLNEHVARYAFAARLAGGARVLDAGCGVGYGSARLAQAARRVVGLEVSWEAVAAARRQYASSRLEFVRGDCLALPFPDGSFDLVVALEVIEHLPEWEKLLAESRRVLTGEGRLLVSTPNRLYYQESRESPNPFHVREFNYRELGEALAGHFPHCRVFLENHADGLIFSAPEGGGVEAAVESGPAEPDSAHFFMAVCSNGPLTPAPGFVFLPQAGNVLRAREQHIGLLNSELGQKNRWLEQSQNNLERLHSAHQALEAEAAAERERARRIIEGLEQENARKTQWSRQLEVEIERLKGLLVERQAELDQAQKWALSLEAERAQILENYRRLEGDLQTCGGQLRATEADLASRTEWARSLDRQVQQLAGDLNLLFGSLAYRIGRRIGLAPTPASDPRAGGRVS